MPQILKSFSIPSPRHSTSLKSPKRPKLPSRWSKTKSENIFVSFVGRSTKTHLGWPSIGAAESCTSSTGAQSATKFSTARRTWRPTNAGTSLETKWRRKLRRRKMKRSSRLTRRRLKMPPSTRSSLVVSVAAFSDGKKTKIYSKPVLSKSVFHSESYLKKHLVSHQVTPASPTVHEASAQKVNKIQSIVQQNVHQRFIDFERERRRFQSFSELYFQQRSAFQYVCHQNYR